LRERGRVDRTTKMGNQQNIPTPTSTTSGCSGGDEMGSGSNKQQGQKTKKGKKK
jgi:hypothetical protein